MFLTYALRNKHFITTGGIVSGMVFGVIGCAIAQIMHTQLNYAFIGIMVSLIAMLIVSAVTRKKGTVTGD